MKTVFISLLPLFLCLTLQGEVVNNRFLAPRSLVQIQKPGTPRPNWLHAQAYRWFLKQRDGLAEVKKISFLIHPGFLTDPSVYSQDSSDRAEAEMKRAKSMYSLYLGRAGGLQENELMVVVLHDAFKNRGKVSHDLFEALKRDYQNFISDLQKIAGKRLVIIPGELGGTIPGTKSSEWSKMAQIVKSTAEKNGFSFKRSVSSIFLGETSLCCVPQASVGLRKALRLSQESLIDEMATDKALYYIPLRYSA